MGLVMTKRENEYRDPVTKQYSYFGRWERMCVCGHTLGVHCAGGFECDIGDPQSNNRGCKCQRFKEKKTTLADVAVQVMTERGQYLIWYGDPDMSHEIAERFYGKDRKSRHPLNVTAGVIQSCAKSKLFKKSGYIEHLGKHYPVYEIITLSKGDL